MVRRRRGVVLAIVACAVVSAVGAGEEGFDERFDERFDEGFDDETGLRMRTSTFSICAIDPERGECGVAVTTRVPQVGRLVPWVRAGVGAVATQAFTQVRYGPEGLDLLEAGTAPGEAIETMLADDARRESRQLGMIDMTGRTAQHTGADNGNFAGGRMGEHYTVQGNLLAGRKVIDAVAEAFESTAGGGRRLADRLIEALEAGQRAGGDKRKGLKQSAAVIVASAQNSGVNDDHIMVNLQVAEHPTPVAELRRQHDTIFQRLGYREFSLVSGRDVVEMKRMLHRLGYFREGVERLPNSREDAAMPVFDEEAAAAVDRFRAAEGLPVPADGLGHAAGIVDDAFVRALRAAYGAAIREEVKGAAREEER